MDQAVSTLVGVTTSRNIRFTLQRMQLDEAVSRPYRYVLDVSGSRGLDIDRMLDMGVAVRIDQPGPDGRYFHGVVDEVSVLRSVGRTGFYRLVLVPVLAQLARCGQQRVYAEQTLPDLLADMLDRHDIAFDAAYVGNHVSRELVVQYNESDLDLFSRLCAEAGIFYWFEHTEDGHTLLLRDDPASVTTFPGYATHAVVENAAGEGIVELQRCAAARVRRIELDDVDPDRPSLDLSVGVGTISRYDTCQVRQHYPGGYSDPAAGAARASTLLDAARVGDVSARGVAVSRGIATGRQFTLPARTAFKAGTALTTIETTMVLEAGPPTAALPVLSSASLRAEFVGVPYGRPLPLPQSRQPPRMRGPHTATVSGPAGQPVHVDAGGRVQLRFPWQPDDDPTPWARVRQNWAGDQRGLLSIPRVGDEVLVEFEHGDVRRPIVVGALFNGTAPPVAALPDNAAQTILQTRALDGSPGNAIVLDDSEDAQRLALNAGRDFHRSVAHDADLATGNDANDSVGRDRSISVGRDDALSVGDSRTVTVGANQTVSVGKKLLVDTDRDLVVASRDALNVSATNKITIVGKRNIVIKNDLASIELRANGEIRISGERVTIKATGRLTLKGADVVEQEG